MEKQRILVVDDEESLCEILQFNLEQEGYDVDVAYSAEEVLKKDLRGYSLLLLDVMMGPMSGFTLARRLKQSPATASLPIIFCTAKDAEDDTVAGLNLGADDYISKPFSLREVKARVRSVLRRSMPPEQGHLSFEGLTVNTDNKTCTVDGESVTLTRKEMDLLIFFLSHRNTIYSRAEILDKVWRETVVVLDRTIDVNITRLRRKLSPYGSHIVTRQGYGYGFQE